MRWAKTLLVIAPMLCPSGLLAQSTGRITGTVVDSGSAQPITGANVLIVGSPALRAQTNTEGRFTIINVPPGTHAVRAQRLGFTPSNVTVSVVADQTVGLTFEMQPQSVELEAVVTVGYGTQLRRDLTGSVSTVNMEANERASIATLDQMLAGTSAGVQVTTASSEPGGALTVRVRGTSSITGNSEPLYVIDGFAIENDIEGSSVGNGGRERTTPPNPLSTLNPSDIESISILKDASSTAIYGARGANGVVIITTKQGRGVKPTFSLDYYTGLSKVSKRYELLNTREFINYTNTFTQNSSAAYTAFDDAEIAAILASGVDTDWQDEIFRTAGVQNFQLAVRGATSNASPTRYAISGGMFDQDGIVVGSGIRRLSARINLNQSIGSRFEFGGSLSAARARTKSVPTSGQQNSGAGAISAAIQYAPILPVKRADGTYSYLNTDLNEYDTRLDGAPTPNPVSLAREVKDSLSDTRFLANVFGQVEVFDGLEFKSSFGTDYADRWRYTYYPRTTQRGEQSNGEAIRASSATSSWLNENTLTYSREFNQNHRLNALGGYTRQATDVNGDNMNNTQFVSDITGYNDIGAGTQDGGPSVSSRQSRQTLVSYLGRVNYALFDRYLFTGTYRADGSSRFAAGKKWGKFPSAAFAWRASAEPWMQSIDAIDELKFRISYGVVGNPSIRPYNSLARLNDQGYSFGGSQVPGYYVAAIGNPDLTWESTRGTDYGVDVEFLERFSVTADYYRKRTTDLLLQVSLDPLTGFRSALANRGTVDNKGLELSLNTQIFKSATPRAFGWRANLNYATNKNKVVSLGGPTEIEATLITTDYNLPGTKIRVGEPVGVFYGFRSHGVIRDSAQAAGITHLNFNGGRFEPGDMLVEDIDGDGQITLADRTTIGDPTPDFTIGLTNTFTWRSLELTGLLHGSYGGKILNVNRIRTESSPRANISRERFLDAWSPDNPNGNYPKIGENPNQVGTNNFTTNLLEDGDFLRLQTVTLSFILPELLVQRSYLSSARAYITGTNLFTITDYTGYNPDVSGQSVGNTNRGIDIGTYPLAKGVTVGVNFTY